MSISVVIPIYKVEPYIERCIRSLMEQTLNDAEFIFVDDCSPDKSMDIAYDTVADYPQRSRQVVFLRHEENRGLPAARNTGLAAATGDYVFHCDSDDYLEPDALRLMYEAAQQQDADIVYSDWYLSFPKKERYMKQPDCNTPIEALQSMLHGTMKYNVWNKLVKRELYCKNVNPNVSDNEKETWFPEGHGMGEDMTMILLMAKAKKVAYLPKPTYHYVRQNENAFTATHSARHYDDLRFNAQRVIDGLQGRVSAEDLACFKLNVKFPYLISSQRVDYVRWNELFPEANEYINNHHVSRRARLLEKAAAKKRYWILKTHYHCVHRLVYGLIFKV